MDPCIKKKRGSLFPKGETGSLSLPKKASQSSRLRAADCIFLEKVAKPLFRQSCAPACSGRGASVYFLAADSSFSCLGSSASGLRRRRAFSASQMGMGAMARASTVTHWVRSMGHTENTP